MRRKSHWIASGVLSLFTGAAFLAEIRAIDDGAIPDATFFAFLTALFGMMALSAVINHDVV